MFAILLSLVVTVATAGESSLNIPGVNTTYLLDVWITRPHMAFRVLQYQYPALTYPPRFLSVEPEGQNALTCSSSRFMCDLHCLLIGPDGRTFAGVKGIKSEELQNSTAVIPTFTQSGATQVNCTLVFHHPDNSSIVDEIKNVVYLTAFKGSCEDAPDVVRESPYWSDVDLTVFMNSEPEKSHLTLCMNEWAALMLFPTNSRYRLASLTTPGPREDLPSKSSFDWKLLLISLELVVILVLLAVIIYTLCAKRKRVSYKSPRSAPFSYSHEDDYEPVKY